ncbi:MAG: energy-coupling factor transporter transmembrane protein EcfT [Anaerofustis stercorihominis]|nr:energy-coupling factor transporter transmembrane protein EcfT [Anaerofustis stercorihominis]
MSEMTIGQYYPADSFVHKLDPRTKIMITLLYIVFIFTVKSFVGYIAAFVFLVLAITMSKIPVSYIIKGLKPIMFIVSLTIIINILWTKGENLLFSLGFIKIYMEGVIVAAKMGIRLMLLVSTTSIMTLSTSTIDLTDGMEMLMRKVPLLKRSAHDVSMMMSIALRFIPTLQEETDRIMKAQKSRGADFDSGNIIAKAKAMLPILIPLFVSAFQRAGELAMAMEARCYQGGEGRTRMKQLSYTKLDGIAYAVAFVFYALMFASRFVNLPF